MKIRFENCDSFVEQSIFVLCAVSILIALLSATQVYADKNQKDFEGWLSRELWLGFGVFFSGRHLNKTGKKWRIPYVCSVYFLVISVIYMNIVEGVC